MRLPFSPRIRWLLSLILVCGTGLFLFLADRMPSRLELLTSPPPQRKSRLAFLGRWEWPVKTRLLRIKQAVWGLPRVVRIVTVIAEFDPDSVLREFEILNAVTNAGGDKVFVVRLEREQRAIFGPPRGQILSQPGVVTADGREAQISMTERSARTPRANAPQLETGYWLNVLPRVYSDGLGLTCFLTRSGIEWRTVSQPSGESISEPFVHTNVAIGAQLRLPRNACLLLMTGSTNSEGRVAGVFLSPVVEPKK